jgi:hypothetical protein
MPTALTIRYPGEHRQKRKTNGSRILNSVLAVQEPEILTPIVGKLMDRVKGAEGVVVSLADYSDHAKWDIVSALAFGANFCILDYMGEHPFLHVLLIIIL